MKMVTATKKRNNGTIHRVRYLSSNILGMGLSCKKASVKDVTYKNIHLHKNCESPSQLFCGTENSLKKSIVHAACESYLLIYFILL